MKIFILIAIVILLILKISLKFSSKKENKTKIEKKEEVFDKKAIREELLLSLKRINRFDLNGYEGDTKKEMEQIKEKVYFFMEELMNKTYEEKIEDLKKEVELLEILDKEFTQKLKNAIKNWETLEEKMVKGVETMSDFFTNYRFFPHEFVHDTNRLQRKLEDLREKRRVDPLSPIDEMEVFTEEFLEKVRYFKEIHKETSKVFESLPQGKQKVIELKEELSIYLQQGKTKKAEKILRELKKLKN